mmetsp:Transcript_16305/g.36119  ORF Transcript_16305/g.36119 Transcript_16305/m.36119 type:complete len:213 (+) Transcript_16305:235-873(+)
MDGWSLRTLPESIKNKIVGKCFLRPSPVLFIPALNRVKRRHVMPRTPIPHTDIPRQHVYTYTRAKPWLSRDHGFVLAALSAGVLQVADREQELAAPQAREVQRRLLRDSVRQQLLQSPPHPGGGEGHLPVEQTHRRLRRLGKPGRRSRRGTQIHGRGAGPTAHDGAARYRGRRGRHERGSGGSGGAADDRAGISEVKEDCLCAPQRRRPGQP